MSIKEKILLALNLAFEDIGEARLIDILLDSYREKTEKIKFLEWTNAREREDLHREREELLAERKRMQNDPLYCASGQYFFLVNGRKFGVSIRGSSISAWERQKQVDYSAMQVTADQFNISTTGVSGS